jgi:hypothetical protein
MKLITSEVIRVAKEKSKIMSLGGYSRLKISGEISNIVIQTTSSGIWFHNVTGTIGKDIADLIIGFKYYGELD